MKYQSAKLTNSEGKMRAGTILLTGAYLGDSYGTVQTRKDVDYPARVELMTKITLRAIEMIDQLDDLKDIRER